MCLVKFIHNLLGDTVNPKFEGTTIIFETDSMERSEIIANLINEKVGLSTTAEVFKSPDGKSWVIIPLNNNNGI